MGKHKSKQDITILFKVDRNVLRELDRRAAELVWDGGGRKTLAIRYLLHILIDSRRHFYTPFSE